MKTIVINGASDDLIEVTGDIREEFYAIEDKAGYLACSDGTLLTIEYSCGGYWRINRLIAGTASYQKMEATDPDDDYSDKAILSGDIKWITYGDSYSR